MKTVRVLIGPPASGKSTIAGSMEDAKVLSSDALREEMGLSPKSREDNVTLFKEYYERFFNLLKEQGDSVIVLDNTNISTKARAKVFELVKKARKLGVEVDVEAIVCTSSIESLIERDSNRDRQVGKDVILRLLKGFNAPHFEEGFTDIKIVKTSHSDDIDLEFVVQVIGMQDFEQHNPHHNETVGTHTATALEVAIDSSFDYNIITALIFHDFGKLN